MAEEQRLRIGIVGAGGIVRARHLPGLRDIPGVDVVAVANRTRESGERVAAEWRIPHVVDDWRQLVAREDIDAVLIGTWPYTHCAVTLAALEAGKHVFCQARMAMNLGEARLMLQAAMASDRVTMLCPAPHGLKGDRVVRRLLGEDFVGRLRLIRLTSLSDTYADPARPLTWRQDRQLSGRNVLALGIYAEVIHRWVGYAKRVSAMLQTVVGERPLPGTGQNATVELPDSLVVVGLMESGAELNLTMSGVIPNAPHDTLEVYGDQGALVYDFAADALRGCRGSGPWADIPISPNEEGRWTAEADFVAAIRQGRPKPKVCPDFLDGYKYMEFVEAVWQSHGQHRHVDLPMKV